MTEFILHDGWPLLLTVSLKSLFVLALAAVAALVMRRGAAAARHLVWRLALVGLLALPPLALTLPGWHALRLPRPVMEAPPAPNPGGAWDAHSAAPPPAVPPVSTSVGSGQKSALPPPSPPGLGAGGQPSSPSWPVWAFGLWLAGVFLTALPYVVGLFGVWQLERRCARVTDGPLPALVPKLACELGVRRPITLLRAIEAFPATPMTWGWRRPTILLPKDSPDWPEDRLRAVLLHELAHIARGDWPAQTAAQAACALYWFHPGVWLAARQARLESERACDDRVLLAGVSAPDYARHLLDVARNLRGKPFSAVVPMAQSSHVEGRLRAILQGGRKRAIMTRRNLLGAGAMAVSVLVPLAVLRPVVQAEPNYGKPIAPGPVVKLDRNTVEVQGVRVRADAYRDKSYQSDTDRSRYAVQITQRPSGPTRWELMESTGEVSPGGFIGSVAPRPYARHQRIAYLTTRLRQFDTQEERVTFHNLRVTRVGPLADLGCLTVTQPQTITTPDGVTVTLPPQNMETFGPNGVFDYNGPPDVVFVRVQLSPSQRRNFLPRTRLYQKYQLPVSLHVDAEKPVFMNANTDDSAAPVLHLTLPDPHATFLKTLTLVIRERVDLQDIPLAFTAPIARTPPQDL